MRGPAILTPSKNSILFLTPDKKTKTHSTAEMSTLFVSSLRSSPILRLSACFQVLFPRRHHGALMLLLQGDALRHSHSEVAVPERRRRPLHLHLRGGVRMWADRVRRRPACSQKEKLQAGLIKTISGAAVDARGIQYISFSAYCSGCSHSA